MEHMKALALNICIVVLIFGLLRGILPGSKYEKYVRLILNLIFILLIINGTKSIILDGGFDIPETELETTTSNVEMQLKNAVVQYLNEQLSRQGFSGCCRSVEIAVKEGEYYVVSVTVAPGSGEKDQVIELIRQLAHIDKEQIYVSDG